MEGTPKENDAAGPRLEPLFVPPGAGRGGVKAFADATGGALGLVETTIPAGHGSPLHIHNDEEEAFYVLDGAVDFICGDRGFRADAGAFVWLPRRIPHAFRGVGAPQSRVLVLVMPGGLEAAFVDPERFEEVFRQRHVDVVGPPPP